MTEVGAKPTAVPHQKPNVMFIVIETFDIPTIVVGEDGLPLEFDTIEEARAEAEECQDAIVVQI